MISKKELVSFLESLAPKVLQEDYDNTGWQFGNTEDEVKGVLLCLDVTEAVVEEAKKTNCNLIISHHPVIFKGIKKITGANWTERLILKAIKNDISVYSIHTNLDAVFQGVNAKIGERLELKNLKLLSPKKNTLLKLAVFCPVEHAEKVRNAICEAGAGNIGNYSECSFSSEGTGTFRGNENTNPFVGEKGKIHLEKEVKLEVVLPDFSLSKVVLALIKNHPYEEVAYDIFPIKNDFTGAGSGMIGELDADKSEPEFLDWVKAKMKTKLIRHTAFLHHNIKKVAFCGGSGRFLLEQAKAAGADVFITADFKYHDFFDADGKILILDIGHFESEQFTMSLLSDWIKEKFNTFAVRITEINTNPVNYY